MRIVAGTSPRRTVGRYELHDEIASGGMATVYLARLRGEATPFSRVVAVKMLHAQYAKEEAFRAMFLDEARLVSRIRHPSVVATLDVLQDEAELFLVMDYVHGESLARLLRMAKDLGAPMPLPVACAIFVGALEGLHAAHEATAEDGTQLEIVHRDVSPQNVLVGADGVARVVDFGVAKAVGRLAEKFSVHNTVKGKAGYMAPEQVRGKVDRRTDVYATGVMLWEALTGERLFTGESFLEIVTKSLDADVPAPSARRADVPPEVDAVVLCALARDPGARFATALEMAVTLERAVPRAGAREVGAWVRRVASDSLAQRSAAIARIEQTPGTTATDRETMPDGPAAHARPAAETPTTTVDTVGGVTPPVPVARPSRSPWPWVALAAIVVAGGVSLVFVRRESARSGPATAGSAPIAASVAPPPASSQPPAAAASAPPEAASTPPVPSMAASAAPSSRAASPGRRTTLVGGQPPAPTSAGGAAARSSAACHWEQLPGPDGIYIPKKVCP